MAALFVAAALALAGDAPRPATQATTSPSTTQVSATRPTTRRALPPEVVEAHRTRLLAFLHGEYGLLLKNSDWVTRALAVISIARFPNEASTNTLLELVRKDPHPAVQVMAWEGLLARAELLDAEEFSKFVFATWELQKRGHFRGDLRPDLARVLQAVPPSPPARQAFLALCQTTARDTPEDEALLEALGKCLGLWRSPDLVDEMIRRLGSDDDALRAAKVLEGAGCPVRPSEGGKAYVAWWRADRSKWKELKAVEGEPWRGLRSDILPTVLARDAIDPDEKRWRRELELRRPDLKNFDVTFCVDVSGSMGSALEWLKTEVTGMMNVLAIFAREPRIGLTYFDCRGGRFGVQSIPLTATVGTLTKSLAGMTVQGGGEELAYDGICDALKVSRWAQGPNSRKVVIIVSDEEIEAAQVPQCATVVAEAVRRGFKFYALSPDSYVPRTYEELAQNGGGAAFPLNVRGGRGGLIGRAAIARARAAAAGGPVTPMLPGDPLAAAQQQPPNPTAELVRQIVSDAVTPEYRDRIAPLVTVVFSMHTDHSPPQRGRR